MPRQPGTPKTGGRKAGTPNKRTVSLRLRAEDGGILPLAYMLDVMRAEHEHKARRDEMARAAAPYLHARPKGTPVALPLPEVKSPGDVLAVTNAIANAASTGAITIDEALGLTALVDAQRKSIELVQLEARITALEGRLPERSTGGFSR